MADTRGVLVFAEVSDGKLTAVAREALGIGTQLAKDLGGGLAAVVLGKGTEAFAKELAASGAQTVYTHEDEELATYQPDAYLQVLQHAVSADNPKVVLMGHTDTTKDLAPKLAFRLGAGVTLDCVDLAVDSERGLVATKPVYGGNARAISETKTDIQMATIRAKAFEPVARDESRQGVITPLDAKIDPDSVKVKVLEVKKEESTGLRLEDAPIVISGGRGLGGPDPFQQLEELAKVLGGAVGASRAVCDAGWMPHSIQVGLTGKTVTPDLYITVAISGASQHMAGCSGAKIIVAINKDKDCNMFKEARYGVEGDWQEILPAFIEMCRELRGA